MKEKIYEYIKNKTKRGAFATPGDVAKEYGIGVSNVSYYLTLLTKEGRIVRNGTKITTVEHGGLSELIMHSISLPEAIFFPAEDPRYMVIDLKRDKAAKQVYEMYKQLKGKEVRDGIK